MVWDIINTMLEFGAIYLIFHSFTNESLFNKHCIVYIIFGIVLSVYFCLDLPHYLVLNVIMFVMIQQGTFLHVESEKRIKIAVMTTLIVFSMELMLISFLPEGMYQSFLGDSVVNIIMICVSGVFLFFVRYKNIQEELIAFSRRYFPFIAFVLAVWTLLTQLYLGRLIEQWKYIPGLISILILFFICCGIIVDTNRRRIEERKEVQLYQKNISLIESYISELKKEIHEYKHHMNHLRSIIETETENETLKKEVRRYVEDVTASSEVLDTILAMDSSLYRAELFGCYMKCIEKTIHFELICSDMLPGFPIEDFQLVQIIGNLIANAIEYNETLEEKKRFIKIELFADYASNLISISNAYFEESMNTASFFEMGYSTKSKNDHYGMGLSTVEEILSDKAVVIYVKQNKEKHEITFTLKYEG